MIRILLACSVLISVYGASINDDYQLDGRIVGGHAISINQAPYQAAYLANGQQSCGASIISSTFVLSAAHCSINHSPSQVSIRVGSALRSSGGTVHPASQIINHAGYPVTRAANNDISLIKVSTPFVFSATVKAIGLASGVPGAGSSVVTSGWGRTTENGPQSNQLLQVQVNVISQAECNKIYSNTITNAMICAGELAGGKDSCQGDSGGPLVSGGSLVGVVSWGTGCARKGYAGVYASVPYFRAWIRQNAGV